MDNNARNRYELHAMVTNVISDIMERNSVPAYMMEDALIDILSVIKEVSFREYMAQVVSDNEKEKASKKAESTELFSKEQEA